MPTSGYWQIAKLVEVILALDPRSVLDIGVGFGKYGFLAREYLEFWDGQGSYERAKWRHRIDGIEAHAEYITPVHQYLYNHLYIGNAKDILPTLDTHYDLVLLIDVLEHFAKQDGLQLLETILPKAQSVLVCLPKQFFVQGAVFGNPYEAHRAHWTRRELRKLGPCTFVGDRRSTICLFGAEAGARWKRYQRTSWVARIGYWVKKIVSREAV